MFLVFLAGRHRRYPKAEVSNLARFVAVMNFRPLIWRNTHPSVLVDRVLDATPSEGFHQGAQYHPRQIVLFGYVRGSFLRLGMRVHVRMAQDETSSSRRSPFGVSPALQFVSAGRKHFVSAA